RNAVEGKETQGVQGEIDVRGADERRERGLHLHDDRQKLLRIGRHHSEQRRVDLVRDERWRDRRGRRGKDHRGQQGGQQGGQQRGQQRGQQLRVCRRGRGAQPQ